MSQISAKSVKRFERSRKCVKRRSFKAKKTHGFNSCLVISVYPLDIPSIKKVQDID